MNTSSLLRIAAITLAAGGFLWVVKFVVIAATDGATGAAAETVTAILYLTAVALMALGTAGVGLALLAPRHPGLGVLGFVGGLVAWWLSYLAIESLAKAVVGDAGPTWLDEEIGIVTTGAVLMTVGLLLSRSRHSSTGFLTPVHE